MVGLTLASSEGIVERLPSFRLIKSTCGSKAAPTRRAHKETQTPSPCESTLAVGYGLYDLLLVSPI